MNVQPVATLAELEIIAREGVQEGEESHVDQEFSDVDRSFARSGGQQARSTAEHSPLLETLAKYTPANQRSFGRLQPHPKHPHSGRTMPLFGTSKPTLPQSVLRGEALPLNNRKGVENSLLAKSGVKQPQQPTHPLPKPQVATKQKAQHLQKQAPQTAARNRGREAGRQRDAHGHSPLHTRKWEKEETIAWYEARYQEKEKERHGGNQQQEQQEAAEEIANIQGARRGSRVKLANGASVFKPILERPKIGIFACYYILTKIGILSDGAANFAYKKEIEDVDMQTTETHKKRLEEMKKAIDKERAANRWSITAKVFSWIASLMGVFAGLAMIATGVGAVAGAMLVCAGVIQLTNQIMSITGAWRKIADKLPGDDPDRKRAIISWMQIGIAVLCLALSGVGIVWGGMSSFGEAMSVASAAIGGITGMGQGVAAIGGGIVGFMYSNRIGEVKRYDRRLAQLKHTRQNLMEKVEWGIDRLEQLFEDLSRALDFETELFRADQMINRR